MKRIDVLENRSGGISHASWVEFTRRDIAAVRLPRTNGSGKVPLATVLAVADTLPPGELADKATALVARIRTLCEQFTTNKLFDLIPELDMSRALPQDRLDLRVALRDLGQVYQQARLSPCALETFYSKPTIKAIEAAIDRNIHQCYLGNGVTEGEHAKKYASRVKPAARGK